MTLWKSLNRLREGIIKADLKPDKKYVVKGNMVEYCSINKLRRELSPVFVDAGVDFKYDIVEVSDYPGMVRAKLNFTFTDIETGEHDVTTTIADGPIPNGSPEKAISIATAYAIRNMLNNRFFLADGIDLGDLESGESVMDVLDRVSVPETPKAKPKEQPKIVSIPVKSKEDTPKVVPKAEIPTVPTEKQAEKPTENAPVTDEPKQEVSETEVKVDKPVWEGKTLLSNMEKRAATNGMNLIEELYKGGKVVEDTYLKAKELYFGMTNSADVLRFMDMKREIESESQKVVKEGM